MPYQNIGLCHNEPRIEVAQSNNILCGQSIDIIGVICHGRMLFSSAAKTMKIPGMPAISCYGNEQWLLCVLCTTCMVNACSTLFWDIMLCLPPAIKQVSCLVYSSTLKMEATFSSETSVDFQRTTRHYIPEESTLHNPVCRVGRICLRTCFNSGTAGRVLIKLGMNFMRLKAIP
jgi:hypothetical protein